MELLTRAQIIQTARQYNKLPYRTQGRDRYGLDCGGLLVMVCTELGISSADLKGYSNSPDGETFERLLQADLDEVVPKTDIEIADVIACDYGAGVQHVAIITKTQPRLTVLHAKRGSGIVEQYLHGRDFRAWTKTFRIRNLESNTKSK